MLENWLLSRLAEVRSNSRLREMASRCKCICVLDALSEAGFAGLLGICRMAALPLAQVWSCERLREFVSVYAFRAHCLKQDLRDCLGFAGWRPCHWYRCGHASDDESCTRVCECLCAWGSLSEAGFAGLFRIGRMAALPLAQLWSCER